jgi:hypothetical protein
VTGLPGGQPPPRVPGVFPLLSLQGLGMSVDTRRGEMRITTFCELSIPDRRDAVGGATRAELEDLILQCIHAEQLGAVVDAFAAWADADATARVAARDKYVRWMAEWLDSHEEMR